MQETNVNVLKMPIIPLQKIRKNEIKIDKVVNFISINLICFHLEFKFQIFEFSEKIGTYDVTYDVQN